MQSNCAQLLRSVSELVEMTELAMVVVAVTGRMTKWGWTTDMWTTPIETYNMIIYRGCQQWELVIIYLGQFLREMVRERGVGRQRWERGAGRERWKRELGDRSRERELGERCREREVGERGGRETRAIVWIWKASFYLWTFFIQREKERSCGKVYFCLSSFPLQQLTTGHLQGHIFSFLFFFFYQRNTLVCFVLYEIWNMKILTLKGRLVRKEKSALYVSEITFDIY